MCVCASIYWSREAKRFCLQESIWNMSIWCWNVQYGGLANEQKVNYNIYYIILYIYMYTYIQNRTDYRKAHLGRSGNKSTRLCSQTSNLRCCLCVHGVCVGNSGIACLHCSNWDVIHHSLYTIYLEYLTIFQLARATKHQTNLLQCPLLGMVSSLDPFLGEIWTYSMIMQCIDWERDPKPVLANKAGKQGRLV
jgi:hypothetical protein